MLNRVLCLAVVCILPVFNQSITRKEYLRFAAGQACRESNFPRINSGVRAGICRFGAFRKVGCSVCHGRGRFQSGQSAEEESMNFERHGSMRRKSRNQPGLREARDTRPAFQVATEPLCRVNA